MSDFRFRSGAFLLIVLILVIMSVMATNRVGAQAPTVPDPSFAQEIIVLVNAERSKAGLPPLRDSTELATAAQVHSQAMAERDFFSHQDPGSGSGPGDRALAAGYRWQFVAENISQGPPSPVEVVKGWMESSNHKANILTPLARETGVGYSFDPQDKLLCGNLPCAHYWTQLFGAREGVYPVIINGEAYSTTTTAVNLYIYGQGWAQEMRLRDDQSDFMPWEPYQPNLTWTFSPDDGLRTITVELRSDADVLSASDTIYLVASGMPAAQVSPIPSIEVPLTSTATATSTPESPAQPTATPSPTPTSPLLPTPTPLPAGVPGPVPDAVALTRNIDPPGLSPGQVAQVTIRLDGQSLPECRGIPGKPSDVVLVFDISSSAGAGSGSNWEQTQRFTHQLLDQLAQPVHRQLTTPAEQSRLALVTSQTTVTGTLPFLSLDLTDNYGAARAAVDTIVTGGDTDIAAGVTLAADTLAGSQVGHARSIVLMLHDNVPITPDAINAVAQVRAMGIPVYLMSNSRNILSEKQITQEMAARLVDQDKIFFDPKPEDLRRLFIAASEGDPNGAARNFHLADVWDPPGLVELFDVTGPGGRAEANRVIWDVPRIDQGETIELAYKVKLLGDSPAMFCQEQVCIDCNGYLHTVPCQQPGTVPVTPVPTLTPSPTEGPSPTPTPTLPYVPPPGPTATRVPLFTPPAPPSTCRQIVLNGAAYCTDWYLWLPPFLLPLLLLLLWWLVERWRGKGVLVGNLRCGWQRLACLLLLLYSLFLAFLLGRALSAFLCALPTTQAAGPAVIATATPSTPVVSPTVPITVTVSPLMTPTVGITITPTLPAGAGGSQQIALVDPGYFMPRLLGFTFTDLAINQIDAINLQRFDTLVFSQVCDIATALTADQKAAIVNWVGNSGKLILYDSDVCGGLGLFGLGSSFAVDYSWLPYPFVTDNPGGRGSSKGILTIVANDTMISADPVSSAFIDTTDFGPAARQHTDIGDANVMVTHDLHWCADAEAHNVNNQHGAVHAYAFYGRGLMIYNGLDTDDIGHPMMMKLWQQELAQPWDPISGQRPAGLLCQRRVFGGPVILWPLLLLPLLPLALLCWLLCRRSAQIREPWRLPPDPRPHKGPPALMDRWQRPAPIWNPGPALVIGLGGTGRWVLTHLKKNLLDAGLGRWNPNVRLLAIDAMPQERIGTQTVEVRFGGVSLEPEKEMLVLSEDLTDEICQLARNPRSEPELAAWFPAEEYDRRLTADQRDVRLGTGQRRPLGRAVVFHDIQKGSEGSDASCLWRRFWAEVHAITQESGAQVFIVGSLAGGFGSGVLYDVAYLVHRALPRPSVQEDRGRGVSIAAFLATDNAFAADVRSGQMRLNAAATLRELNRFRLAWGRPYPMRYRRGSADPLLDDYCTGLFDECYLFDGERAANALTLYSPQVGLFPVMADALMVFLDRTAAGIGNQFQQDRTNTRTNASTVQRELAEAVVSGLGTFTYRLPILDIVESLKVRFARELMQLYLGGPRVRGRPTLKADTNREVKEASAEKAKAEAQNFLSQRPGDVAELLYRLAVQSQQAGVQDLQRRSQLASAQWATLRGDLAFNRQYGEKQGPDFFRFRHVERFRVALQGEIVRILNGDPLTADVVTARAGKLGYAQAYLDEVKRRLQQAREWVDVLQAGAPATDAQELSLLQDLAQGYLDVVSQTRTSLLSGTATLLDEAGAKPAQPGEPAPLPSLYDRLLAAEHERGEWREQLRGVKVRDYLIEKRTDLRLGELERRYFPDEPLLDEWYRQYFAPHLATSLERLFWRAREDGQLEFVVRHWNDVTFTTSAAGAEGLAQALLELAEAVGQEVWRETLKDYLDRGLWQRDALPGVADRLRAWGDVPLTLRMGRAVQSAQSHRYLWGNQTVQQAQALADTVGRRTGTQVSVLQATDPNSATMLTTLDVLPFSALDCTNRLSVEYARIYALTGRPEEDARARQAEPTQVFAAERHALAYEQRLHELKEPPRLFHPLFVAALENLERARTFSLAFALGLVYRRHFPDLQKGAMTGYQWWIRLPSQEQEQPLARPETEDPVASIVAAMRAFVLAHESEVALPRQMNDYELAEAVAREMVALASQQVPRLQAFLWEEPTELQRLSGLGQQDFLSFTRLVVRDKLVSLHEDPKRKS